MQAIPSGNCQGGCGKLTGVVANRSLQGSLPHRRCQAVISWDGKYAKRAKAFVFVSIDRPVSIRCLFRRKSRVYFTYIYFSSSSSSSSTEAYRIDAEKVCRCCPVVLRYNVFFYLLQTLFIFRASVQLFKWLGAHHCRLILFDMKNVRIWNFSNAALI